MASGMFVWPECTLTEYHSMCVTIPHSVLSAEKREEDEARQSEYVGVIACTLHLLYMVIHKGSSH